MWQQFLSSLVWVGGCCCYWFSWEVPLGTLCPPVPWTWPALLLSSWEAALLSGSFPTPALNCIICLLSPALFGWLVLHHFWGIGGGYCFPGQDSQVNLEKGHPKVKYLEPCMSENVFIPPATPLYLLWSWIRYTDAEWQLLYQVLV